MTPEKSHHCRSLLGPWSEDDRKWFAENPGKDWRLRDAMEGELLSLRVSADRAQIDAIDMLEHIARSLEPTERVFRMVVFQVMPGIRHRIPVLGKPGDSIEGPVFFNKDGAAIGPDAILGNLRENLKSAPVESTSAHRCYLCLRALETAGVYAIVERVAGRGTLTSIMCVSHISPNSLERQTRGFHVYISPRDTEIPFDQWPRAARRRWQKATEAAKQLERTRKS